LSRWKFKLFRITPIHIWFVAYFGYEIWGNWEFFDFMSFLFRSPTGRRAAFALLGVTVCVVVALCLFPIFVGIMRVTVRTIAKSTSPMKIIELSLFNIYPILVFYALIVFAFKIADFFGEVG